MIKGENEKKEKNIMTNILNTMTTKKKRNGEGAGRRRRGWRM